MNIEGFISQTLQQIGAGIVAGQKQPGITVSPRPYLPDDPSNTATGHMIDQKSQRIIVLVQFDLSVVVQSKIGGDLSAILEAESSRLGLTKRASSASSFMFLLLFHHHKTTPNRPR